MQPLNSLNNVPEYRTWKGMRYRCQYTGHHAYADYGGRGIRVCERWSVYANFFADMGERPSRRHSIDRIDNDGNYEPENCRWATKTEQNRNARSNPIIEFEGKRRTLPEWAEVTGIPYHTLRSRWYHRDGPTKSRPRGKPWTIERMLTQTVKSKCR